MIHFMSTATEQTLNRKAQLRAIADAYFGGLTQGDVSHVPYDENVLFRTPLAAGGSDVPLRGRSALLDFFAGIYAANDDTGGGAIAAMKAVGLNPAEIPVTGQDSTVAGLQRILTGEQYLTIFKPIVPEAEIAAEMAISLGETGEVSTRAVFTGAGFPSTQWNQLDGSV